MPKHPPHTYSHEDVLFLVETARHCKEYLQWIPAPDHRKRLRDDIDRCIKILESEDEI